VRVFVHRCRIRGVDGHATGGAPRALRERVRFYLFDHRTRVGRAIDVALLALDLAFVAVFVVQSYAVAQSTRDCSTAPSRPRIPASKPSTTRSIVW